MAEKKLRAIRINQKICTQANRCTHAFTFVEVLVALAVVSISLLALLRLHLISVNMADKAQITAEAILLAQEKIAEILAYGYPEVKTESGVVDNSRCPLHWQTQVNNLQLSQLSGEDKPGLREILVDVSWNHGIGRKNVQMSTLVADRKLQ